MTLLNSKLSFHSQISSSGKKKNPFSLYMGMVNLCTLLNTALCMQAASADYLHFEIPNIIEILE